jgi:hypothetical protein
MILQPLKLTQEQLEQVMRTAAPIPPERRDEYLRRLADQLCGPEFGDGEVYRACRAAAKAVMWNMQRAINEAVAPRDREPNRLLTSPTEKGRPIDPVKEERTDRRREELERRELFDRLHTEASRRLRALRRTGRKARGPMGAGDGITPVR